MVAAEGSNISDGTSQGTDSGHHTHRTQADNQLVLDYLLKLKNTYTNIIIVLFIKVLSIKNVSLFKYENLFIQLLITYFKIVFCFY